MAAAAAEVKQWMVPLCLGSIYSSGSGIRKIQPFHYQLELRLKQLTLVPM